MKKFHLSGLSDRALLANLYATQGLMLLLACILLIFQGDRARTMLASPPGPEAWFWGCAFAAAALSANVLLERFVPEEAANDALAEKIFRRLPLWHIALLCLIIAISEELLFRGAIQHWLGPYWTSIVFALLHVRYLNHWLLTGFVFCVSYGFGWLAVHTGPLWTPIAAHFLFDFAAGSIIRYRRQDGNEGSGE